MTDEAGEDVRAVAEALEGAGDPVGEPAEAREAAVAELDVLEVAPEVLDRVEIRRVAGEPLELEPGGRAGGEEILTAWPRWADRPSQMTSSLPGMRPRSCLRKRTTPAPSKACGWVSV